MSKDRSADSPMQELFLREVAKTFRATTDRIACRLETACTTDDQRAILDEEMKGLYHGLLVIFDGGSALADHGLVGLVDEDAVPFKRWLHEIGLRYWPDSE